MNYLLGFLGRGGGAWRVSQKIRMRGGGQSDGERGACNFWLNSERVNWEGAISDQKMGGRDRTIIKLIF